MECQVNMPKYAVNVDSLIAWMNANGANGKVTKILRNPWLEFETDVSLTTGEATTLKDSLKNVNLGVLANLMERVE